MGKNKTRRAVFLALLLPFVLAAQQFQWKARLNAVNNAGFYEIKLDPRLTAKLKSDLSDLRIQDARGTNVAYLLKSTTKYGRPLVQLPILKLATDTLGSSVEVSAKGVQGTDHLALIIGNTAVARPASISGSNDRKRWFIIADDIVLAPSVEGSKDRLLLSLSFPFNRYEYLKITIRNGGSDPLDILEAAIYNSVHSATIPVYVENGQNSFEQQERAGKTILTVRNKDAFITDRLTLDVKGPRFYKRQARLFITSEHARKPDVVRDFQLTSGTTHQVDLPSVKARSMTVEIENGDNPPLEVVSVRMEQEQRSVIAYLQRGNHFLLAGNPDATAPKFDLAGFADSIPPTVPVLAYAAPVSQARGVPSAGDSRWLWFSVVLMIGVLGYFTFRLTKDVQKAGKPRADEHD